MIYKRFTEKSAEEWRQIYKALQLMEFLIKNGSERVIDDARSHLSLLKMLRQFHYIDQNGKDQGINVRNRSKELTELLSDVDRIRSERKKARSTRNKYGGVEGGAGLGGASSASRYGGFGSESGGASAGYGGATRGVYGDGGGFGGESHDDYDETGRTSANDRFDEYDEYDDGGATAPAAKRKPEPSRAKATPKKPEVAKPKEPEVDLFDFGDEPAAPSNGTALTAPIAAPSTSAALADDDDFDDFQSAGPSAAAPAPVSAAKPNYSSFSIPAAPTAATQFAQPVPHSGTQKADFSNLFSTTSPPPGSAFSPPAQAPKSTGYQPSGPNYFQSVQVGTTSQPGSAPASGINTPAIGSQPAKKPAGGDAFAGLLAGSGMKKSGNTGQKGLTIADMAKQKSTAGLYGANAAAPVYNSTSSGAKPSTGSSGLDDLLG